MRSLRTRIVVLSLGVLASLNPADSETQVIESKRITGAVTYVTPGVVYFNAGSLAGLQTGDTLTVLREEMPRLEERGFRFIRLSEAMN